MDHLFGADLSDWGTENGVWARRREVVIPVAAEKRWYDKGSWPVGSTAVKGQGAFHISDTLLDTRLNSQHLEPPIDFKNATRVLLGKVDFGEIPAPNHRIVAIDTWLEWGVVGDFPEEFTFMLSPAKGHIGETPEIPPLNEAEEQLLLGAVAQLIHLKKQLETVPNL